MIPKETVIADARESERGMVTGQSPVVCGFLGKLVFFSCIEGPAAVVQ
jgi:hypothetical protein